MSSTSARPDTAARGQVNRCPRGASPVARGRTTAASTQPTTAVVAMTITTGESWGGSNIPRPPQNRLMMVCQKYSYQV